jgi:hypothetical protein
MSHVRLTRIANLVLMVAARELEGLPQRSEIVLGTILANLSFQLVVEFENGIYRNRRRDRRKGKFGSACRLGEH